ncbi:MAG: prephenate dehydrogenase/arogenate dehydrogenase family protein [Verrucomicrobia bacterium]|nr:prephenate dehydrogenase/arogenate dehydrogenase family protein [Verrucomicrobiota bacterium]|tara:strand:+ start:1568 stop:2422 length:855 start_codon:yes stop_codon:yes gene_type:complete
MNQSFKRVSILGGGLLGGSIALALQGKTEVRIWFRKPTAVAPALELGLENATSNLAEAVGQSDLLILAVPVGAMPALLEAAIAAGLPTDCLVTDVGSVKQAPHSSLAAVLEKSGNPFIGSHPMAGSEQNGLVSAKSGLFDKAACLLTNDSRASDSLCERLEIFWQSLGCRISWFSASEHDNLVARISHLPHVIAAAGAQVALENPDRGLFGGGGLRDTTRIASGNPEMWAEILTENREAVIPAIHETIAGLRDLLASLEKPDQELVRKWLASAKELRDTLPGIP